MLKAFISSTGKDLGEYREAAIEICNLLGIVPIAMEFFEAMGKGATEGSKLQLDEASLYIGIFAHRYGYIEDGCEKSVTEIEFDYAGERGLDRLCYLVKLDYPWPPDLIDYKNYALLHTLKDKINSSVIRSEFTTVDDFKAKLIQGLVMWQKKQEEYKGKDYSTQYSLATPFDIPPRPALVIGRENEIATVKSRLGVFDKRERKKLTIIRGLPGVGKTTFAKALMYDKEIRQAFTDGVLWASLGESAKPSTALMIWGKQFRITQLSNGNLETLINRLHSFFENKNLLLIADDIWEHSHAVPCKQVVGGNSSLVITTRFNDVANSLADLPRDDIFALNVLSEKDSLELLTRIAPFVVEKYPTQTKMLVQDLEGLPLILRVAGRLLASESELGLDVSPLFNELRESNRLTNEAAPDDRFDYKAGLTPTINYLLQRSTDCLDEITRGRFAKLGAFAPKPATFNQEEMSKIWGISDPLPTIRKLVERGLLDPIVTQGLFQLHAVFVLHAKTLLNS